MSERFIETGFVGAFYREARGRMVMLPEDKDSIDRVIVISLDKCQSEIDRLNKKINNGCPECGCLENTRDCKVCGAPNCCPSCCRVGTLEALNHRLQAIVDRLPKGGSSLPLHVDLNVYWCSKNVDIDHRYDDAAPAEILAGGILSINLEEDTGEVEVTCVVRTERGEEYSIEGGFLYHTREAAEAAARGDES